MPVVLDLLWRDHANMALVLKALERQYTAFNDGGDADFGIIQASLDYCQAFPDRYHHPKEDAVLRKLRQRDPAAAAAVGDLEDEHQEMIELTAQFASLVEQVLQESEFPRDQLSRIWRQFLDNYRRHMRMEEQALFQKARNVLTPEDWLDVGEELNDLKDPMFGAEVDARFQALKADIEAIEREAREARRSGQEADA